MTKLLKQINCPTCNGIANLISNPKQIKFQGKTHNITEYFYKCPKCNMEFTTTESDTKMLDPIIKTK